MADDVDRELSEKYCPRFAEIAVKKGYVKPDQAKEALNQQIDDDINNRPHRLIGSILLENAWMTPQQIEDVLNEMFKQEDSQENL